MTRDRAFAIAFWWGVVPLSCLIMSPAFIAQTVVNAGRAAARATQWSPR